MSDNDSVGDAQQQSPDDSGHEESRSLKSKRPALLVAGLAVVGLVLALLAYSWLSPSLPESASELDGYWSNGEGVFLSLTSYGPSEKSPLSGNPGTNVDADGQTEVDGVPMRVSGRCRFSDDDGATTVFGEFGYDPETGRLIIFQFGPMMPELRPVARCNIASFHGDRMSFTTDDGTTVRVEKEKDD